MTRPKRQVWPIWLAIPTVVLVDAVVAGGVGWLLWAGFGRPPLVFTLIRVAALATLGFGMVFDSRTKTRPWAETAA
jgi:fumarate reductase subunit C